MADFNRDAERCSFWAVLVFRDRRKRWIAQAVDTDVDEDGNFEVDGRLFHIDAVKVNVDQDGSRTLTYTAYEQPWLETKRRWERYEGPIDNPTRW